MTKLVTFILAIFLTLSLMNGLLGCQTTTNNSDSLQKPNRIITDMFDRKLTVPKEIKRVVATSSVETLLTYMVAPNKLAGLSFNYNGNLVPKNYKDLPVIGGWFGTQTGNYETFMSLNPDIILEGQIANIEERQSKFGIIPVVGIKTWKGLTEYEYSIRFFGELVGEQKQAESVIAYYKDAMKYVNSITSQIPISDRIKVYYAEGKDGLSTDPKGSLHTQLLDFCGGINVADVAIKQIGGMVEVSIEHIMLWDPDMIIIGRGSQVTLYKQILSDPRWSQLRAIKHGQVFIRPDNPFSWFDGPFGPNQIVGMYWMINTLYPDKTTGLDLDGKIKEFYSKFYHYDLTNAEIKILLSGPS